MTAATADYVPGVCNINRAEIKRRRNAGYFGLILTILLTVVMFGFDLDRWVRVILFVPVFIAAIGFLQAKNRFCVGYGAAGLQNATDGKMTAEAVANAAHKQADKRRARRMNIQATLLSIFVVAILILIP